MSQITRRDFLGVGAMLVAPALARGEPPAPLPAFDPDLVLLNGRVYTMDDSAPRAEAFAVRDGRFVAIGTAEAIRNGVTVCCCSTPWRSSS